jgi:hypothetical protein
MRRLLPDVTPERADEAEQSYSGMLEDVARQAGARPAALRGELAEEEQYLKRLCLLLLDASGCSSAGPAEAARISRRVKAASARVARGRAGRRTLWMTVRDAISGKAAKPGKSRRGVA